MLLLAFASFWAMRRLNAEMENFRLGLQGERYVAALLDELRDAGYRAIHDVPGRRKNKRASAWNIDHILVGPSGVYAIETKTLRKWADRSQKLRYDGEYLSLDGKRLPEKWRKPLEQAQAGADFVQTLLKEVTARKELPPIHPVVLYPGWYVETDGRPDSYSCWVMNPKGFATWLRRRPRVMSDDDVALYHHRLASYVRQTYAGEG